jgi:predicted DNA-binding protein
MQVALNSKVSVETAQRLDEAAKELGRSKASIVEEALKEWFKKQEKAGS